jgi:hypothetical protein
MYWSYVYNPTRVIINIYCQIQRKCPWLLYVNYGRGQIQRCYSSANAVINIQLKVSPLQVVICLQFDARYYPQFLPNTAQIGRFLLCQLRAPSIPAQLQLCRFSLKYSIERIPAFIADVSTIRCTLYSTLAVKCSAHHPVDTMSTVVTAKSTEVAVMHILS